jgi:hypothetical protein
MGVDNETSPVNYVSPRRNAGGEDIMRKTIFLVLVALAGR